MRGKQKAHDLAGWSRFVTDASASRCPAKHRVLPAGITIELKAKGEIVVNDASVALSNTLLC
jgi:hypothetical protein